MSIDTDGFKVSITNEMGGRHLRQNIMLYYVIEGCLSVHLMRESCRLEAEDFIIINRNRVYQVDGSGDVLAAVIEVNYPMLCRLANKSPLFFCCNSAAEAGTKYEKFRYMARELLNEYALDYSHMSFLKLSELYRLCHYMVQYFGISGRKALEQETDSKVEQVLQYTEENFRRKLSLEEAAGFVYMTPTSFSRFFRKSVGITYMDYVNQLRMNYAGEALLYSGHPITEIALECGFSNPSVFDRAFKKAYGVSPRQYKELCEKKRMEEAKAPEGAFAHSLEKYQNKRRLTVVREQRVRMASIHADMADSKEQKNPWRSMLNLGHAPRLLSAEYQKQIALLKRELGFTYGCLTGIFSEEMKLREKHGVEELNFGYVDNVLDCLVENGIRPVITFDNQMMTVLKNYRMVESADYHTVFRTADECIRIIDQMLCHFIYRYGEEEAEGWMFDLWYAEFKKTTLGLDMEYAEIWDRVYECIHKRLPHAKVGGSGAGPSLGYEKERDFYIGWKSAKHRPDFLSLNIFPYHQAVGREKYDIQRDRIENFFHKDMEHFRKMLKDCGFPETPIYVLQWNLSFVQRNYYNDTSAKAAMMLRQMADGMDEAEGIAYWAASDLLAEDYDATRMLNGSAGLISRDGIRKPALYAVEFMGKLLGRLVSRGEFHVITTDGRGHLVILLFNHKKLGYQYYAKEEVEISLEVVDHIYLDEDALEITLEIDNVENRNYIVHRQLVGPDCGDALNEWRHLGADVPMRRRDVAYLNSRSVPYRKNDMLRAEGHKMVLLERLKAHEFMMLDVRPDLQEGK